jgi:hypothetical protein
VELSEARRYVIGGLGMCEARSAIARSGPETAAEADSTEAAPRVCESLDS